MNSKGKYSFTYIIRFLLVFVFLTSFLSPIVAQGNLLIYPKRIVFEGKTRTEKLVLSNTGKDTAVYNISFLEYKMDGNGDLITISEPEEGINFASSYVRFFPRKVTLPPNEAQIVKIEFSNSKNLGEGEYRSHLYFRAEDEKSPLGQSNKKKDSILSVNLKAVFGISIPCIIRIGDISSSVDISDIKYSKEIDKDNEKFDVLRFKLNRKGSMSTYGDFIITYTDFNNNVYEVGKMNGVGIYTPNLSRNMGVKLKKIENMNFNGGTFKVVFYQNESKKVLTEAILKL